VVAIDTRLRTAMARQLIRRDAALARGAARVGWKLGAALEIVELNQDDAVDIIAANIFHRGVVFGALHHRSALRDDATGAVEVNGRAVGSARLPSDLAHRLRTASRTLHAMRERFIAGDRVITGSAVQVPVRAGDDVTVTIAGLSPARARI
jgi:hypothetical protein